MSRVTDISVRYLYPPFYRYNLKEMTTRRGSKRERILRVLLNHPDSVLTKYSVSKNAGTSFSWTHEFLMKLERDGYVEGSKVLNYEGLVRFWAKHRLNPGSRDYLIQRPLELLRRTELAYALTTYQAETLVQGYLFPSRIDLYVKKGERGDWHGLLSREGLVGEGNVRVLFDDDHVFYDAVEVGGLRVVSMPQLIVDLLLEGGVCVEAAEMLLAKMGGGHVR